ncbi:hypothetical protein Asfd1_17 [Aeromonas phage Asfd_1]|nr:hypothetical protein Asfd1_17 [Aeromonas phage Asfd_1]
MSYEEWLEQNKEHMAKFLSENMRLDTLEVRKNVHQVSIYVGSELITREEIYV